MAGYIWLTDVSVDKLCRQVDLRNTTLLPFHCITIFGTATNVRIVATSNAHELSSILFTSWLQRLLKSGQFALRPTVMLMNEPVST